VLSPESRADRFAQRRHYQGRIQMRSRTLCLTAVACVVLIGCATPRSYYFQRHPLYVESFLGRKVRCDDTQCTLTVTVTNCAASDGIQVTNPDMSAGPDIDLSHGDASRKRTITFNIATTGYEFARESFKYGILIKSDPGDEFSNARITNSGRSLSIDYLKGNPSPGQYTYGIQLRSTTLNASGGRDYCELLDPWLIS